MRCQLCIMYCSTGIQAHQKVTKKSKDKRTYKSKLIVMAINKMHERNNIADDRFISTLCMCN